jgi:hypothetical protein
VRRQSGDFLLRPAGDEQHTGDDDADDTTTTTHKHQTKPGY